MGACECVWSLTLRAQVSQYVSSRFVARSRTRPRSSQQQNDSFFSWVGHNNPTLNLFDVMKFEYSTTRDLRLTQFSYNFLGFFGWKYWMWWWFKLFANGQEMENARKLTGYIWCIGNLRTNDLPLCLKPNRPDRVIVQLIRWQRPGCVVHVYLPTMRISAIICRRFPRWWEQCRLYSSIAWNDVSCETSCQNRWQYQHFHRRHQLCVRLTVVRTNLRSTGQHSHWNTKKRKTIRNSI